MVQLTNVAKHSVISTLCGVYSFWMHVELQRRYICKLSSVVIQGWML